MLASGSFRAALLALACFALVLLATGAALHRVVGATMLGELEEQIAEEVLLLRSILKGQGEAAMVRAVGELARTSVGGQRLVGLFDADGEALVASTDVAPGTVGWRTVPIATGDGSGAARYRLRSERLGTTTVVIGRSTRPIDRTLDALAGYLLLAGCTVAATTLTIGYLYGRDARDRLAHMYDVLDRIGHGDMRARMRTDDRQERANLAARRINGYLDELATLMSDTRNTVGALAHDLRTPLNRASVRLQEAASALACDAPALALVESAGAELDGLGDIFETILRIGRVRASEDRSRFATFPASEPLLELADAFGAVFEEAGRSLRVELDAAGSAPIRGDPRMLRQLLSNLLTNALTHTGPGGGVTLRAGTAAGGGAVLVVADDGPGIPAGSVGEVLKPFVRLDASRALPGSGLGLALVDAIARHHRARLALLDNAPGLRVVVEFPPVPRDPPRARDDRPAATADASRAG